MKEEKVGGNYEQKLKEEEGKGKLKNKEFKEGQDT